MNISLGPTQTTIPRRLQLAELQYRDKYKFTSIRYKIQGAKDRRGKGTID